MMQLLLFILLLISVIADCPIDSYPRKTLTGSAEIKLNNEPTLHGTPIDYIRTLAQSLDEGPVSVAIGVLGIQFNSHGVVNFAIDYIPETISKSIKFKVLVNDSSYGWKTLQFNYFISQSNLTFALSESVTAFSGGIADKYSIYLPKFIATNFQPDPIVKVFLSGINLKSKALTAQYALISAQYDKFSTFSTNTQLIEYFKRALEDKKSMSFQMTSKLIGNRLNVNFQTNCQITLLKFSYIVLSQSAFTTQHSFISSNFYLANDAQYKFTPLQNMDMKMLGLVQFKVPRDSLFSLSLNFNNYFGQASFTAANSVPYFGVGYTFIAFQMKLAYVCDDCVNSKLIFEDKFCVELCPRGYSQVKRLFNTFCQACSIDSLKVIDPNTFTCVCANRHYLDSLTDTCKPCRYDCYTCSSFNQCLTCDNALMQTKRVYSSGKCDCPITGYYDDKNAQNIVCQKCSPKCLTCDGPRSFDCLTCVATKQLDAKGFCVCRNGYTEDINGDCVCVPPRILLNSICFENVTKCDSNKIEQFVDLTRRCVCKSGYQQVLNDCIKCGQNAVFSPDDLTCVCVNNTVKVNQDCVPCQNNTVYDSFTRTCVCKPGSFKADDGSCIICGPKMAYINGRCECIYNFYEAQPNVCRRCLKQTDGPKCQYNLS